MARTETATGNGATTRKPRTRKLDEAGNPIPRQRKPIHVLFRVTDDMGNPVQGNLEVILASNDPMKVLEALENNPGAQRTKVSV